MYAGFRVTFTCIFLRSGSDDQWYENCGQAWAKEVEQLKTKRKKGKVAQRQRLTHQWPLMIPMSWRHAGRRS